MTITGEIKKSNIDISILKNEYKHVVYLNDLILNYLRTPFRIGKHMRSGVKGHFHPHGKNKQLFKEVFGRQHFCYTTWYRSWNWCFEYKSYLFVISSSIRGTSYWMMNGVRTEPYTKIPKERVSYEFFKDFKVLMEDNMKNKEL